MLIVIFPTEKVLNKFFSNECPNKSPFHCQPPSFEYHISLKVSSKSFYLVPKIIIIKEQLITMLVNTRVQLDLFIVSIVASIHYIIDILNKL